MDFLSYGTKIRNPLYHFQDFQHERHKIDKDNYTYPVEGWYWLNNKEQVYAQFNLKDDEDNI